MSKTALIYGITGQDGSYLAEFLLEKGYKVHGVIRRSSSINTWRIDHLYNNINILNKQLFLHYGDITDSISVIEIIHKTKPDEIYNLAAQSHVRISFEIPEITANIDALGTLKLLEIIKNKPHENETRVFQAASSELYGKVLESPQNENTPFNPRSPYAIAKLYAYWITKNYREAYGLFAVNGILFNHESERRGFNFVTRKITVALSKIKLGQQEILTLGNLNARRDWGYAKEYVEAMWLMLQQDKPDDYVIATGENYTIREFVELVAKELDLEIEWQGKGPEETGLNKKTGEVIIKIDPKYFRPTEVDSLLGDASKAKQQLGWTAKVGVEELVRRMVKSDYALAKANERILY